MGFYHVCLHQALLEAQRHSPRGSSHAPFLQVPGASSHTGPHFMRQRKQGKEVMGYTNTSVVASQLPSSESGKKHLDMVVLLCNLSRQGRPGAHWPASPAYWRVADQGETLSQ